MIRLNLSINIANPFMIRSVLVSRRVFATAVALSVLVYACIYYFPDKEQLKFSLMLINHAWRRTSEKQRLIRTHRKRCFLHKNVLFLKTHKTGSTTLSNLFYRHADSRNLTVALPWNEVFSFFWPWNFHPQAVVSPRGSKPNVFCNHARFTMPTLVNFMPAGTRFVTILREPAARFESAFIYEAVPWVIPINREHSYSLSVFLDNLDRIRPQIDTFRTLQNSMAFDLGLEPRHFCNTTEIERLLKVIENQFDLVLILELFDESLVLLKRLLCWNMDDVIYLKHNVRLKGHRTHPMNGKLKDKLIDWNKADMMLYDYFKNALLAKISAMDNEFWEEVKILRQRSRLLEKLCMEPGDHMDSVMRVINGLTLKAGITRENKVICEKASRSEAEYMAYFRKRQS